MPKTVDVASAVPKLYELLSSYDSEERAKLIRATLSLFGEGPPGAEAGGAPGAGAGQKSAVRNPAQSEKDFFDAKDPGSSAERFAVAAYYREKVQSGGGNDHTKDSIKATVVAAKRPFDSANFSRDMGNARTAKLFNPGKAIVLSHLGESYVEALPDRAAARAVTRAAGGRRRTTKAARAKAKGKAKS